MKIKINDNDNRQKILEDELPLLVRHKSNNVLGILSMRDAYFNFLFLEGSSIGKSYTTDLSNYIKAIGESVTLTQD